MNTELPNILRQKRSILGFDAGCISCSDLAKQIEETVGDKLEVRSLRDPQMEHWRKQALGENAPWAPTLIEVENGQVKAWTGVRMGAQLSRVLGPVATWRVIRVIGAQGQREKTDAIGQTLGGEATAAGASAGLTRAQLLKGGLAGAVIGAGLLVAPDRFMSSAIASESNRAGSLPRMTGTRAEQNKAKAIVRSSGAYKKLARDQKNKLSNNADGYSVSFDFKQAVVNVEGEYASVVVSSLNPKRSMVAAFIVDLSKGLMGNVLTLEATPVDGGRAANVVVQENFREIDKFGDVTLARDHMVAEGRSLSYGEAHQELDRFAQSQARSTFQVQARGSRRCNNYIITIANGLLGGALCYFICAAIGFVTLGIGGLACTSVCFIVQATGSYAAQQCVCAGRQGFCPYTTCP